MNNRKEYFMTWTGFYFQGIVKQSVTLIFQLRNSPLNSKIHFTYAHLINKGDKIMLLKDKVIALKDKSKNKILSDEKKQSKSKTPRSHKPEGMSIEEWQIALRREFAATQNFEMENVGSEPIFSDFIIVNPATGGNYRVAIRGETPGNNYCSCPDYSINTLGTCKHIEFTLFKLRQNKGAEKVLKLDYQPPYSEIYLRYGKKRNVIFKPGSECPAWIKEIADKYFDADCVLKDKSYLHFDEFLKKAGSDGHEIRCFEDAIEYIARHRDQEKLKEIIDEAFKAGPECSAMAHILKTDLYPYQKIGALFAARAGRSIIADDMGLGKTIQAIGACDILSKTVGIERALIICPTSLKHQWKQEIEKFTDKSVQVIEGMLRRRESCYNEPSFYKITNYDVVNRDREFIKKWGPDIIILDEAQRIKNWKTRTAQSVKRLDSQYAIVLTGTPLENRLEELHSIVEFVDRYCLGPRFRFLDAHQITDEADGSGKIVGYKNLTKIADTLSPILIRRLKSQVLQELPGRLEKKFFVEMTKEQMNHHDDNREIAVRIVAKWRRYKFLSDADQRRLMIALQNMRMSCDSTYLLDRKTDFGVKADELAALLNDILQDEKNKVVIFSQWTRMHELIIRRLQNTNWKHVYFHGGVPGPKRKELIRQFKEERDCRLFLATDAGGVGLNLQHASVVVNMDIPWNPAVLEQRIGRVHRLGQQRPVSVINFIANGTIEHGMLSLLDFKKSLFTGVLDGGQDEVFLGGSRLKRFMESVEKVTNSIPEAPPAQEEVSLSEAREAEDTIEIEAEESAEKPKDAGEQAWADLANVGVMFLEKLGQALAPASSQEKSGAAPKMPPVMIEHDQAGRPYFKLPVPKPETIKKFADLLYQFVGEK